MSNRRSRLGQSTAVMSIRHQNRQRESSRKNRKTETISDAFAVNVSSPWASAYPLTAGASAPATVLPSVSSVSFIFQRSISTFNCRGAADFLLEQQHAIQERFGRRRAAWHVNVDRHDTVAAADHRVGKMIVAAAVGAGTHRDHITGFWHLVVNLAQRRRHLIGERAGDDHHVGLPR